MVLDLTDNWRKAMRSGCAPIWMCELVLGPIAFLTVLTYTAGSSVLVTLTVVHDAGTTIRSYLGDTDFACATSNEVTATNIAAAINADDDFNTLIQAFTIDNLVVLVAGPYLAPFNTAISMSFLSGSDVAWAVLLPPIAKSYKFVSGPKPYFQDGAAYPATIDDVKPTAASVDPVTQEYSIGDVQIIFEDKGHDLRPILARCWPKGKKVILTFGTVDLAEADFAPFGVYYVDSPPLAERGSITFRASEPSAFLRDQKFDRQFIGVHPLSALRQIYDRANYPSPDIDADSFDRANYPTISHWAVSRHNMHGVAIDGRAAPMKNGITNDQRDAETLKNDLCLILNGSVIPDERGLLSFRRVDITTPTTRDLTEDDYDELVQEDSDELFNKVLIQGCEFGDDGRSQLAGGRDDLSIRLHSPFGSDKADETDIPCDWIGTFTMMNDALPIGGTTLRVPYPFRTGMSGTRLNRSGLVTAQQDAEDTLTSGRTTLLLLLGNYGETEIVEATSYAIEEVGTEVDMFAFANNDNLFEHFTYPTMQPQAVGDRTYLTYLFGAFTVTRAQKGTTELDWKANWNTRVYDVTIAFAMLEARLRFSQGAPRYSFRTSLDHFDLQHRDVVTFEDRTYLQFNRNGSTTTTKFEIIAKEREGPGRIKFTVARLADVAVPVMIPSWTPPIVRPIFQLQGDYIVMNNGDHVTNEDGQWLIRG